MAELKRLLLLCQRNSPAQFFAFFCEPLKQRRAAIVEFSSPNVAKPFHVGHLRSTLIGKFVASALALRGERVTTVNYLGDWGTQFAFVAVGYRLFGSAEKLRQQGVSHLYDVYVRANALAQMSSEAAAEARTFFHNLEAGRSEEYEVWKKFKDLSVESFHELYDRLGVKFDLWNSESQYWRAAKDIVDKWVQAGVAEKSGEADVIGIRLAEGRFIPLMKSDGTTLYLTRDIAAALHRDATLTCDRLYYVVDNGQHGHFENLKLALAAGGHRRLAEKIVHVKFGRIRGMSTRQGSGVFISDLLEEGSHRALDLLRSAQTTKIPESEFARVAGKLAMTALVIQDLKHRRGSDYSFSWDAALSTAGNSGYVLQATHARLYSVLEQNHGLEAEGMGLELNCDPQLLTEPQALKLVDHLSTATVRNVMQSCVNNLEPCHLVHYLFRLCHLANAAYNELQVQGTKADVAAARLLLFAVSRSVLRNGMMFLNLEPLNKV